MNPTLYINLGFSCGILVRLYQITKIFFTKDKQAKQEQKQKFDYGWEFFAWMSFWVCLTGLISSSGFYLDLRLENIHILVALFCVTMGSYCLLAGMFWLINCVLFRYLSEEERKVAKICCAIPSSTTGKVNIDLYPANQEAFAVLVAVNHVCGNIFTLMALLFSKDDCQNKTRWQQWGLVIQALIKLIFSPATFGIILSYVINQYVVDSCCESEIKAVVCNVIVGAFSFMTMTIMGKVIADSMKLEILKMVIANLPLLMLVAAMQVLLQPCITTTTCTILASTTKLTALSQYASEFLYLGFGTVSTSSLLFLEQKKAEERKKGKESKAVELYAACFLMQLGLYLFASSNLQYMFDYYKPLYDYLAMFGITF